MCRAISGIAVRVDDATVAIKTLRHSDSHEEIRKAHGIGDTNQLHRFQTPIELVPVGDVDIRSTAGWMFVFDASRPDWWTEDMTRQAREQLDAAWKVRWDGDTLHIGGDLDLGGLTSLPANAKLSAGGDLDLGWLTSLPAGAKLSAGGSLDLGGLTSLPEDAKLSAGCNLYLRSLTALPARYTPICQEYVLADGTWRTGRKTQQKEARP